MYMEFKECQLFECDPPNKLGPILESHVGSNELSFDFVAVMKYLSTGVLTKI